MLNLSVIVPVYSGEKYLRQLTDQLHTLKQAWENDDAPIQLAELIFVDDNAIDGSADLIDEIAAEYNWVVALHLSRNFGQHPATIAGILHSCGDWVVTMDEDLQHSPASIPLLLKQISSEQSDIVFGRAKQAVHESGFRDVTSKNSKKIIEFLSGNKDITKASSFRLIRGVIARAAASVCSHDTYFDVALTWFSQRIQVVEIEMKDQRFIETGKSGYNLKALLSHGRRLLFSNQIRPLRIVGLFGVGVAMMAAAIGVIMLCLKLVYPDIIVARGWLSLFLLMSFLSGTILFMLSIILEYLSLLVLRAHGKPLFFTIDRSSDKNLMALFSGNFD